MRHLQLINWKIVIYSFQELKCLSKGDKLSPSFDFKAFKKYMEDLKKGKIKALPMGAYEYSCCVQYLKKIRHELWKNRKNFKSITLVFDKCSSSGIVLCPLEDCLEMVAEEVGFSVINEEIEFKKYEYTLRSEFLKRG